MQKNWKTYYFYQNKKKTSNNNYNLINRTKTILRKINP